MGEKVEESTKTQTCSVNGDDILPLHSTYTYSCSRPVARDRLGKCIWHTRALSKAELRGELLDQIRDGDLPESYLPECDLSGVQFPDNTVLGQADLTGADLRCVELSSAQLWATIFSDADLRGADLSESYAIDADFDGAVLRDANLSEVRLTGGDLSDADLRRADLSGASLLGADLSGADLRGADLSRVDLKQATISDTQFQNADLSGTDFGSIDVTDAKFENSFMWLTHIQDTVHHKDTLDGADMFGLHYGRGDPDGYIDYKLPQYERLSEDSEDHSPLQSLLSVIRGP